MLKSKLKLKKTRFLIVYILNYIIIMIICKNIKDYFNNSILLLD